MVIHCSATHGGHEPLRLRCTLALSLTSTNPPPPTITMTMIVTTSPSGVKTGTRLHNQEHDFLQVTNNDHEGSTSTLTARAVTTHNDSTTTATTTQRLLQQRVPRQAHQHHDSQWLQQRNGEQRAEGVGNDDAFMRQRSAPIVL